MTLGILAFAEGPISSLGKQDAVAVVTGLPLTSTTGTAVAQAGAQKNVTGEELTSVVGIETIVTTSVAAPTGLPLTSTTGNSTINVIANPTVSVTGFGLNQVIGTYAVTAGGQVAIDASAEPDMDMVIGDSVVSGTASLSVTGLPMSTVAASVTVDAVTPIAVTGLPLTSTTGSVSVTATGEIQVTGQVVNSTTGNVSVDASATALPNGNIVSTTLANVTVESNTIVSLTGLSMDMVIGDAAVYAWVTVDDAANTPFANVDDSATNTWTNVNDSATNTWQDAA